MKLIQAKLIKQPRLVTTKHGPRVVADAVNVETGESLTIWRPHGDGLLNYDANSNVTLAVDSRGKISLIDNANNDAIAAKTEPTNHKLSNTQKKEIASYIEQQKDLLAFCWQQACQIDDIQSEDTIQKMAVTLYLSAQRKFNLA